MVLKYIKINHMLNGVGTEREVIIDFVEDYLNIIETDVIEISHKRNTLKSRVKQLALTYKIPKDYANYISLFLMVTKFIFVEDKIWKVNETLKSKVLRPGFLHKNLFKFLFFTKDYNEFYKSPLVFNTIYANNDFEIISKRKAIINTLPLFYEYKEVAFDRIFEILEKRYAFFREYNDPKNFYYTKGNVFSNKHTVFLFIFKTLVNLKVIKITQKGKLLSNHFFRITAQGQELISNYLNKSVIIKNKKIEKLHKKVLMPHKVFTNKGEDTERPTVHFNEQVTKAPVGFTIFANTVKEEESNVDFLKTMRDKIIEKTKEEKTPTLLY